MQSDQQSSNRGGNIIAKLRLDKGWNQEQLAGFAKMSASTICRIENGNFKKPISNSKIDGLIRALELNNEQAQEVLVAFQQDREDYVERKRSESKTKRNDDIAVSYSHLANIVERYGEKSIFQGFANQLIDDVIDMIAHLEKELKRQQNLGEKIVRRLLAQLHIIKVFAWFTIFRGGDFGRVQEDIRQMERFSSSLNKDDSNDLLYLDLVVVLPAIFSYLSGNFNGASYFLEQNCQNITHPFVDCMCLRYQLLIAAELADLELFETLDQVINSRLAVETKFDYLEQALGYEGLALASCILFSELNEVKWLQQGYDNLSKAQMALLSNNDQSTSIVVAQIARTEILLKLYDRSVKGTEVIEVAENFRPLFQEKKYLRYIDVLRKEFKETGVDILVNYANQSLKRS